MEEASHALAPSPAVVLEARRVLHPTTGGALAGRRRRARPSGGRGVVAVGPTGVEVAARPGAPFLERRRPIGEATSPSVAGRAFGAGVGPSLTGRPPAKGTLAVVPRPVEACGANLGGAPVQARVAAMARGAGGASDSGAVGRWGEAAPKRPKWGKIGQGVA